MDEAISLLCFNLCCVLSSPCSANSSFWWTVLLYCLDKGKDLISRWVFEIWNFKALPEVVKYILIRYGLCA